MVGKKGFSLELRTTEGEGSVMQDLSRVLVAEETASVKCQNGGCIW